MRTKAIILVAVVAMLTMREASFCARGAAYTPSPEVITAAAYIDTMRDLLAAAKAGIMASEQEQQARFHYLETRATDVDNRLKWTLDNWLMQAEKRIADLEVYAKACGDKPGCFTPAQ